MADTSYPYLRCARQTGTPYALVLAYRDALLKLQAQEATHWGGALFELDCWEAQAVAKLHGSPAAKIIFATLLGEEDRQRRVAAGMR